MASGNDCLAHCGVLLHAPARHEERAVNAELRGGPDDVWYSDLVVAQVGERGVLLIGTVAVLEVQHAVDIDVPADREGAAGSPGPAEVTPARNIRHRELRSSLRCLCDLSSPM